MHLIYIFFGTVASLLIFIVFYMFRKVQKLQNELKIGLQEITLDYQIKIKDIELHYQKEINEVNINYEIKIKNIELNHKQEIEKARHRSVEQSRHTIKGQIAEQLAPLLPGFPYLPSDCRFIGSPIDYLIFNGYTECKDNHNNPNESSIEIIIADIKRNRSSLSIIQQQIEKAVNLGKVRFETIRVLDNGEIDIHSKQLNQQPSQFNNLNIESQQVTKRDNYHKTMLAITEKHPNAYKPWTVQDDTLLKSQFLSGIQVSELAFLFKRQPSAINSRLRKLGFLIELENYN